MNHLIPEWAPNIHPLLVHFPIVLLITASLADLASIIWKTKVLRLVVLSLFIFGVAMLSITYLSGEYAIDSVHVPLRAELTASHHADRAFSTLLFYSIYLLIRIVIFFTRYENKKWAVILLFLGGLTGTVFITRTADMGAKLVYKYQVGTLYNSEKNN